jgi:hypothetical protein
MWLITKFECGDVSRDIEKNGENVYGRLVTDRFNGPVNNNNKM